MLVLLDDPAFVDDLCVHFRRSGFTADRVGERLAEVSGTDAPTRRQAEREILMHLEIWRILNPGRGVEPLPR